MYVRNELHLKSNCPNTVYPLRFVVSYVQPVTQHFRSRTVRNASLQSMHTERNVAACPSYINYHLKSKVSIMLCCWLCSTHYTAV